MEDSPLSTVKPSSRVKIAAALYGSGAARTKKEASTMAGLSPQYLSMLTASGNEAVNQLVSDTQRRVLDHSVDTSTVMIELGRKALATIAGIMEAPTNQVVQLKAAIDLADRSPETSKVAKIAATTLTLDGEDAQRLAEALVQSAAVRSKFVGVHSGDFVRVDTSVATPLPLPPVTEP